MTRPPDEDERLTRLLRSITIPELPEDFLAGARRRYLEALDARYRREVVTSLVAAAFAFALATTLLLSVFTPTGLIAWVAVTIASVARVMDGVGIVLSLVPALMWTSSVLASVVALLSIAALLRVRFPVAAK